MPELPEVETVRRVLTEELVGLNIIDIDIRYPNLIEGDINEFKNNIINKKICKLDRLGKHLIFILNDGALLSHLRMEGKFFYVDNDFPINKHIHVIFKLSNNKLLCYQDVRKFGRFNYRSLNDLYTTPPLNEVGVDLTINNNYSINDIYKKIINKKIPIKATLLDQSILAGLGNIYVDEVLYEAHINPNRLSNTITLEELELIINQMKIIFDNAIINKGTTIKSYTSSLGVIGNYQNFLKVHTKSSCPCCKSTLTRVKIKGRMTYYCEKCQR